MAKQFHSRLIETSAKQRINVDEAFYNLVREIRRFSKETPNNTQQTPFGYANQQGQGFGNHMNDREENRYCCCVIM